MTYIHGFRSLYVKWLMVNTELIKQRLGTIIWSHRSSWFKSAFVTAVNRSWLASRVNLQPMRRNSRWMGWRRPGYLRLAAVFGSLNSQLLSAEDPQSYSYKASASRSGFFLGRSRSETKRFTEKEAGWGTVESWHAKSFIGNVTVFYSILVCFSACYCLHPMYTSYLPEDFQVLLTNAFSSAETSLFYWTLLTKIVLFYITAVNSFLCKNKTQVHFSWSLTWQQTQHHLHLVQ